MRWKSRFSMLMTLILVSGSLSQAGFPLDVMAENEAATVETTETPQTTEEEKTTEAEEEKTTQEEKTETNSSETDKVEDKEDTTEKEPSKSETTEATKEEKTESKTGDKTEDNKNTKSTSEEDDSEKDKNKDKKKEEDKDQKEEKTKVTGTEVVEDDSDGRDYAESELLTSGNTTFKIVTVTKNEDIININIRNLRKRRKSVQKELKALQDIVDEDQQIISDIEEIYNLIREHNPDITKKEMYLIGYKKDESSFRKTDSISEMDKTLKSLALRYHNDELIQWTKEFSTEYVPYSLVEDAAKEDENTEESTEESKTEEEVQMTSNADEILQGMLEAAYADIDEHQPEIAKLEKKLSTIQKRIVKQKEDKKNNTIDIDSRLVAYKDTIPNQTITFLNEVVEKEGTPYVWGADGPNAFDCSGLVSYGLRECGAVESGFRWTSQDFRNQIKQVSFDEALPGDLVWKSGHIAIYIDENTVFEAPYTGARIRFTSCNVSSRFTSVLRWWSAE